MPKVLSADAVRHFEEKGYFTPVQALTAGEVAYFRGKLEAFEQKHPNDVKKLKTKAHLLFASNKRLPGPRFHVTVWPDIDFAASGNEAEDCHRLTAAITARIEEMVRADPSQWLWIHNRWPTERDRRIMESQKNERRHS